MMAYVATVVVAVVGALLLFTSHLMDSREEARKETAAALQALRVEEVAREATAQAVQGLIARKDRIVLVTKELDRALPQMVPPGTVLPAGFRLHHDAAAAGVPPAPSGPAAAPVDAQAVAGTVSDNYAACREQDAAYQELQQWLTRLQSRPPPSRE